MSDLEIQKQNHPVMRAISLAEALLCECDEHGFVFAAIDASSALDKLNAIKDRL